eukprot:6557058-Prorocentrum_lima.AAC.1
MSGEESPYPALVARVMMGRTTKREKREARGRIEPRRGLSLTQRLLPTLCAGVNCRGGGVWRSGPASCDGAG